MFRESGQRPLTRLAPLATLSLGGYLKNGERAVVL
jgi:hypothetical protein